MSRVIREPAAVRLPIAGTVVERVENHGRAGLRAGGESAVSLIQARTPRRTGAAAEAVEARVSRTSVGVALRVAPNTKVHPSSSRASGRKLPNAIVWRFLEGGVGLLGKSRKLIPPKKRGRVGIGAAVRAPSGRGFAGRKIFASTEGVTDSAVDAALDAASTRAVREPIA